jgi:hypothetical protein
MLDLFCGTKSVSRVFAAHGWDTFTLDIDPSCNADLTCDILDLKREQLPPAESVSFIWASPPCTQYSRARTNAKTPRDLAGADRVVAKTLEVIDEWFPGTPYCMENPGTGLLPQREVVAGRPLSVVSYCKYTTAGDGFPPYQKDTALWHNLLRWTPRPPCRSGSRCEHYSNGHHPATVARWCKLAEDGTRARQGFSLDQLHAIPPALIGEVVNAATP